MSEMRFAGHNWDMLNQGSEPICDAWYREYSYVQRGWLQPDPSGLAAVNPANPQTWNRYSYAGNNPLINYDSLGLYWYDCGTAKVTSPGMTPTISPGLCWAPDPVNNDIISITGSIGGPIGSSPKEKQKKTKSCSGSARVLQGNPRTIGQPGGWSTPGHPILVTGNGAAVIPAQWRGAEAVLPFLGQISGVFPGTKVSFQGVVDTIGSTSVPNVQSFLMNRYAGDLILELPGGGDLNVTAVKLTIPAAMNCPSGTTEVP